MNIDLINLLITPLVAAAVGFAVWYFQSRIEALRRAQEHLHDDRRKVYGDVLDPFIRVFAGIKNPKETQKALQQMLSLDYKRTAFQFNMIGADEVVRSFNAMMQYMFRFDADAEEKPDPRELMQLWGSFLLEIRKNVGNPNSKLTATDMLRGQIKNIDQFMGPGAA